MKIIAILLLHVLVSLNINAFGENRKYIDFNVATKKLLENVYNKIPKKTIYCKATFNKTKKITNSNGFFYKDSTGHKRDTKLDKEIEWEHVVPVKLFGETFMEWKIGDSDCVSVSKMRILSNRSCAIKTNPEFQKIYSDLHNIYPAIGRINRVRKNYKFIDGNTELSRVTFLKNLIFNEDLDTQFGQCLIRINKKKVIPPNYAKGIIARTYLYMNSKYKAKRVKLYPSQKQLYQKWSKEYPVTIEECKRTKLIEKLQKNRNRIVEDLCIKSNMWK